jgi:hypothetical protein
VALFNHDHDVAIHRNGRMVAFGLKKTVRGDCCERSKVRNAPAPSDSDRDCRDAH